MEKLRVAVLGATGYTGAELLRLLVGHPHVEITEVVGHSKKGALLEDVLPALRGHRGLPKHVSEFDPDRIAQKADCVFSCLPHGASGSCVAELYRRGRVVLDLSGDFRLKDPLLHSKWYGHDPDPEVRQVAVYGLPELFREKIRMARVVALPGCYPTASILPIAPLLEDGLIEANPIIIDAKSGVSGAGREPNARTHYPEVSEGLRAYKVAGEHRHIPEIEAILSQVTRTPVQLCFTPHLVPMNRGILASIYVRPKEGATVEKICQCVKRRYAESPFVEVLTPGACPDTLWIRGTNRVLLSYTIDERSGWLVCQSAIDNLVKGAGGQAIQCMNCIYGYGEGEGLEFLSAWP
ncbi:MAG: N-acetyl-gamma-glutamyl-phosphate reductase [Sandaracinaceae bacterium]|nr:N-acetyl-gamma-glutamyl-phosphate reductase [Sandaracinaceae bacterium]MDW8245233.1 N-acetyl-gamma-glutamyl-phosphate reductase [Sandaracinaceae bacterium]